MTSPHPSTTNTTPDTPTTSTPTTSTPHPSLPDLAELTAIGMGLARDLAQTSANSPATRSAPDAHELAESFEKLSRAIRRTIALTDRYQNPTRQTHDPRPENRRTARMQLIRRAEDAIERNARPDQADSLRAELYERLEDPGLDQDLDTRPFQDILEEILNDLAAWPRNPAARRRTPVDIAILRARAAAPSTPAQQGPAQDNTPQENTSQHQAAQPLPAQPGPVHNHGHTPARASISLLDHLLNPNRPRNAPS